MAPPDPARASVFTIQDDDENIIHDEVESIIRRGDELGLAGRLAGTRTLLEIPDDSDDSDDSEDYEISEVPENEIENVDWGEEPSPRRPTRPSRNPSVPRSSVLECYSTSCGLVLKAGMFVEICRQDAASTGPLPFGDFETSVQFILIKLITYDDSTGVVAIRGLPFVRTRRLGGRIHKKLNELCLVYEIDEDDARPPEQQALLEVVVDDSVIFIKRLLRRTNKHFPCDRDPRFTQPDWQGDRQRELLSQEGQLVCRWEYHVYHRNAASRKARKPCEEAFSHLRYDDADEGFRTLDEAHVNAWRGGRVRGGSFGCPLDPIEVPDGHCIVDLENGGPVPPIRQKPGQAYTFGDMFCGAGGATRGATSAGFKIAIAVDHWNAACTTYKGNFGNAHLRQVDIFDFLTSDAAPQPVDVLHLSPPCQVWSPAHTIPGRNDDANIAILFSCQELVKKLRPRVFTLEQTFGILHKRFAAYFNSMVQGFTNLNYSIRWKIVALSTWGLAAARKRLIVVGSSPGEKLPILPGPIHGDGLRPFVTAKDTLAKITADATLHNVAGAKKVRLPPWNPDAILNRTITCSGGQTYHHDGERELTLRELACLQGFPICHRFWAPGIKRQIGNAFPPYVVKILYDHLREWLYRVDNVIPCAPVPPDVAEDLNQSQARRQSIKPTVIEIEDDNDLYGFQNSLVPMCGRLDTGRTMASAIVVEDDEMADYDDLSGYSSDSSATVVGVPILDLSMSDDES